MLFSRVWLFLFTATATALVVVKHVAWRRHFYRGARTHLQRSVALLGARQPNQEIAQLIAKHPEWGITVAAQLDLNEYSDDRLVEALHEHHVESVMLTTGKLSFDRIGQAISVCETEGVDVLLMADFVRPAIARISFDQFAQRPVLLFSCKPDRAWHLLIKRVIDFSGALRMLLIAGPLIMLPVAIAHSAPDFERTDLLPSGARRLPRSNVQDAQVPLDGGRRRSAQGQAHGEERGDGAGLQDGA